MITYLFIYLFLYHILHNYIYVILNVLHFNLMHDACKSCNMVTIIARAHGYAKLLKVDGGIVQFTDRSN